MERTSLYSSHIQLGAKVTPFAGFEMPLQYSGIKNEVQAVRNNLGVFDVSHMGEIFISGNEAQKFCEFLLTNDVPENSLNSAIYSPLCNIKGGVVDDLIIYHLAKNSFLLCVNASNIEKDYQHILEYGKNFDCKITNQSEHYSLLAVQGPLVESLWNQMFPDFNISEIERHKVKVFKDDFSIIIARTGYTGEDGIEVFGDHDFIKKVWTKLIDNKVTPCGLASRDVLRIEMGYPLYGQELNDDLMPSECALKWTLSKNKKYLGKEVHDGQEMRFQQIKFTLEKGIPRAGQNIIQNDKVIGQVTSGTHSPSLGKGMGIGRVERSFFNKENPISVEIRNNFFPAKRFIKNVLKGAK